jgi:hypothetical protein
MDIWCLKMLKFAKAFRKLAYTTESYIHDLDIGAVALIPQVVLAAF